MILWTTYFHAGLRKFFVFLDWKKVWGIAISIYILIAALYFRKKYRRRAVFIAIGTTCFAQMAIEINIMLAFQIIYGYLYYRLGLIVTSFMGGLCIGAYLITKQLYRIKRPLAVLRYSKISLGLFALLLVPVFRILSEGAVGKVVNIGANLCFPLLMFITGVIGGMQFPIANKVILEKEEDVGRVSGALYGTDLLGAMLGALLVASVAVPVIGVFQCLIAVGILNLVSAAVLVPESNNC